MPKPKYTHDDITYALFGIDPAEFYRSRFAYGPGVENGLADPVLRYDIGYENIRRLVADVQSFLPGGGRVLDIGCGAGHYGPTLRANVPRIALHGVDMSSECLAQARGNGYEHTELFDLTRPLPYPDGYFDMVFSMDLFGHIEFRHKDFLIGEIARVTREAGGGHHGVETAPIDYFNCNPADEADPIRRYVYVDGHIGAEPGEAVCRRFARHFARVTHGITRLHPFKPRAAFAACFDEEFQEAVAAYDHPQATQLANVILGRLNSHYLELYSRVFGPAFRSSETPPEPPSDAHAEARAELQDRIDAYNARYGIEFVPVPRELFRPTWFSSITVVR